MTLQDERKKEFRKILDKLPGTEDLPAIAGVGNDLRADDIFGVEVARHLTGKVSIPVFDTGPIPENYLGKIAASGARNLLIVDAVDFGGTTGEIRLFEPGELAFCNFSTHLPAFQLSELFLSVGGVQMMVLAAQPGNLDIAGPVSAGVQAAIEVTVEFFLELYGNTPV